MIEKIKKEILNSENLDGSQKMEALFLLEEASRAIPTMKHLEIIRYLEDLYQNVIKDEYKDALSLAIKKYKSEIKKLSYDSIERTLTVQDFLESLKIPTKDIPNETLDLKLTVGIDDGMGYSPKGFMDVIESYPDEGEVRIWA